MADIILHHYPNSPFSEKVRLIFGFKKIAWKSVIIPAIMPKPNLTALTGGYRRTPVMQIGAHIYCDTALIADVLERLVPTPSLYPVESAGLARTLSQWADSTLFWTMITHLFQPAGMQSALGNLTPEQIKAFGADRAAFRGNMPRMPLPEATGSLTEYLRRLESMLAGGRPYLLGAQPCIADFSVYHSVWFLQSAPAVAGVLDVAPQLKAWATRMAAFGHHEFDRMSAEQALEVVRNGRAADAAQVPFVDFHGVALGERVAVMPADYGVDPVEGELVLSTDNELAVRRADPVAGEVVVHFPRVGFQLKKA
ncbi:glutathione S-transferase family protein [Noviherbaspirillum autotrophicum]|uniref:Glutathione S-transferase n=1 Tax=Noviherbaspirillum autotrophicum TaxID=709839 RepID=A0A0C2BMR7_9BURK|nr:glutathione S-transferase family protein [Noviherbaspirillum autotrophicum]KIF82545.1 glutathione S-transferase [Noviherbaspirillum autotrophicum]